MDRDLIEEKYVKVDDVNVHITKAGKGSHNILCMPRALGCCETDFRGQIHGLDGKKFTIVMWDPPGYGKSRPPQRKNLDAGYRWRDAALAHKIMLKLKLIPYSILGYDDGGSTALMMAHKYAKHVQKLVLFGTRAVITNEELSRLQSIRSVKGWPGEMARGLKEVYGSKYLQEAWSDYIDALIKCYREEDGNICSDLLNEIAQPTMIIHGTGGMLVPEEAALFLKEKLQNAKLKIKKGARHDIASECPLWFNKKVTRFMLKEKKTEKQNEKATPLEEY